MLISLPNNVLHGMLFHGAPQSISAKRRCVAWSNAGLCVYDVSGCTPVAVLPDAAAMSQYAVFAWLSERDVSVAADSSAFHVWAKHAYKFAFEYGWRLDWPYLFIAVSRGRGSNDLPWLEFSLRATYYELANYELAKTINVEHSTAEQLREELGGLPDLVINQIMCDFKTPSTGVCS